MHHSVYNPSLRMLTVVVGFLVTSDLLAAGSGHGITGHSCGWRSNKAVTSNGRNEASKADGDSEDRLHRGGLFGCFCLCDFVRRSVL